MAYADFPALLAAAKQGADWAWRELYGSLAGQLTGYATAKGVREPDDLAAEVMVRVAENIATFHGPEPAFRSWVFTIAHHAIVDALRAARPTSTLDDVAPLELRSVSEPEREVLDQLGLTRAVEALDGLSADQRDVVLLRVLAGFSVDEVAEILGRRPGTVRVIQHRAFRRLRGRLAHLAAFGVTP